MFGYSAKRAALALVGSSLVAMSAAQADVFTEWNEEWLDTIRAVGGPPCPLARNQALVFIAMYEAVNSVDRAYEPYLGFIRFTGPANKQAAAAAAAHRVLAALYPARTAIYDGLYNSQVALIGNGRAKRTGITIGETSATRILADRVDDRTQTAPPYVYQDVPGAYRPTTPDFTSPPFNPGWGTTKTWCMQKGSEFRPTGPNGIYRLDRLLASKGYAAQYNEVKSLGARNSRTRTAEQTEIAWFWANDRNGTYKPPGHLMYVSQVLAVQERLTFDQTARLFALSALAMADAGAVAWDQKYSTNIDLWRPVSAIREGHTDNNPLTVRQANWLPLLEFTPPFPAYTSGHATFGAAHAAILRNFFGTDSKTFTIGTDEPIVKNVTRTFNTFSSMARENGRSRIYLGVHFQFDADSAFSSGTLLGNSVYANFLQVRDCSGDLNNDGRVNSTDMRIFNDAFFAGTGRADLNGDGRVTSTDYSTFVEYYFRGCR